MAATAPPNHMVAHTTAAPPTTASLTRSPSILATRRPRSPATVDSRSLTLRSSPITTTSRSSRPTPSRDTIPPPPSSPPTATTTTVIRVQTRSPTSMPTHGTHMAPPTPLQPSTTLPGTTHPRAFSSLPLRSPSSLLLVSQLLPAVALGSTLMTTASVLKLMSQRFSSCNFLTSLLSSSRRLRMILQTTAELTSISSSTSSVFLKIP